MIYFDNSATTYPKPSSVYAAMGKASKYGANSGRGAYPMAFKTSEKIYECREAAAELLGFGKPENIVFTQGATSCLNMAIKGELSAGDHAVCSGYEHNAVVRPLNSMKNITYTAASHPLFDREKAIKAVCDAVRPDTKVVICNHISNVYGFILPVMEIGRFCKEHNITFIVDAAQSAGYYKYNLDLDPIDYLCCAGHKGLYGLMGTGLMVCKKTPRNTIIEGGTGSVSKNTDQPDFLPDRLESGTLNTPGIIALHEGIKYVSRKGEKSISEYTRYLVKYVNARLANIPGVTTYYTDDDSLQSGVLSFCLSNMNPVDLSQLLGDYGICVRGGCHCAPLAHKNGGTLDAGTVRLSFSGFNTTNEAEIFLKTMNKISREVTSQRK